MTAARDWVLAKASEVATARISWGLTRQFSTRRADAAAYASWIVCRNQKLRVFLDKHLSALPVLMNRPLHAGLELSVLLAYSLSALTGQRSGSRSSGRRICESAGRTRLRDGVRASRQLGLRDKLWEEGKSG